MMKTYTFHVSLPEYGRVWRKIELPAESTLENLHDAIQAAYDFDNDHLYSFFMSGKAWDRATEYSLPEDAGGWGDMLTITGVSEVTSMNEAAPEALDLEEAEDVAAPTTADMRTMFAALKDNPAMRDQFIQAFAQQTGLPAEMAEMMLGNIDTLMESVSDDQLDEILNITDQELEELDDDEEEAGDVRTTTIESLGLRKGKTFMYLFDYGDEWRFKVKVDAINKDAPDAEYPLLVEEVGEAPAQYADWEDEEGEEGEES
ncbi:MAG: hypothetical protein NT075_11330 [Chloroflexi bacterium]|nr:hypothetical protein [Chloroflexota bacterium]